MIVGGVIVIYLFPVLSISHCLRLCILGIVTSLVLPWFAGSLFFVFFSRTRRMSSLASFYNVFFFLFPFRSRSDELFWLLLEMDGELLGFFYDLYLS
jgi:hypothetical protein